MRQTWLRRIGAALLLLLSKPSQGAPLDPLALRTISAIEVIRLSAARYQWIGIMSLDSTDQELAEIAALDPKVQTLVWLAILEGGVGDQAEPNASSPSFFVGSSRFFTRFAKALVDARMAGRAVAFTDAVSHDKSGDDLTRLDLGVGFGTKAAFDAAIVDYVSAEPLVDAWCASVRGNLTEDDRLTALLDELSSRDAPDWRTRWPEPYRVLLLADFFDRELRNGGIHQYFYNSSGDVAPETVEAMRALKLPSHAETIVQGMGFFASPYPIDQETRRRAFAHDGFTDWDERLSALTDGIGYDAVRPAMIAYAKQKDVLPR